jgi:hypothetical protein
LASAVRSKSASSSMSPYSGSAPATGVIRPSSQPPEDPIFTLFCSTEFKILRVTSNCHALTGFHPHEFINLNLLDWVLPADRQPLDVERARLITGPFGPQGQLQSSREIHAAIMNQPERDLLSPAVGMPEPYPHQNVHIHRADSGYSLFNVRLHLGGGLGGNIYQPETLGQIYLVVSCLFISAKDLPHESARRVAPFPLTPATPLTAPPPHSLPSFSSVVAAADAPPRERERERERHDYPYRSGSGTLPPSAGPPPLGHGPPGVPPPPMFQYRPGGHTRGGSMGGSIGSQGFTGASIRRSPSPIYGRPYTSYPPPGPWYGYERDDRGEHPREIRDYPRAPREIRDPRGVRDPQDVRDPRDLRDVHGSRDPRDWEDPRVSRGDLHVDPRSADSRDPRDLRDMDPRAREEYDRRAAHDERLREPRREDDWRRSAPPAPPPPHTHPHGHPLLSPSAGRHATYPPGVAPPGEARRHPQGPYRLEPPHPHHPPHPPSPHQQSPHQQSPHQGAFRIWEQQ